MNCKALAFGAALLALGVGCAEDAARNRQVPPAGDMLKTAKDVAALVTGSMYLPGILPCSTGAADVACATTFINTLGPRLYRRALSDEERTELVGYYTSVAGRSNFVTGLKWT